MFLPNIESNKGDWLRAGIREPRRKRRTARCLSPVAHGLTPVAPSENKDSRPLVCRPQYLERCLPGYAALFSGDDLWTRPVAIAIARHATSAEAIRQARIPGVTRWLREEEIRFQARTVEKVSGRKLYRHPSRLDRSYVMDKLLTFHREHQTPPVRIVGDLQQAARQTPRRDHLEEAAPLQTIYECCRRSRRKGPKSIGTLLVAVLARLGVNGLESETEAQDPIANVSDTST